MKTLFSMIALYAFLVSFAMGMRQLFIDAKKGAAGGKPATPQEDAKP